MADDFVARINRIREKRAAKAAEVAAMDTEIANLIREAVNAGHRPTALADAIGITRARVYQLLTKAGR